MQSREDKLVLEIVFVFNSLKLIIPDVAKRIGSAKPTWISLKKNGLTTIRDYVLYSYEQGLYPRDITTEKITEIVSVCPLSFNITSNPNTFDIDHFYPEKDLMSKLEGLQTDQSLLSRIKLRLKDSFTAIEVDALIPNNGDVIEVTGLKNIYYNFTPNLWPISGPVNSAKGKKESFVFSTKTVLNNFKKILNKSFYQTIVRQMVESMGLDWAYASTLNDSSMIDLIAEHFLQKFNASFDESDSILPYMMTESTGFVSMLDYFKQTTVGEMAINYARETAKWSMSSIELAKIIAQNKLSEERERQSKASGFATALQSVLHTAKRQLESDDDLSSLEIDSLDSDGIATLKITGDDLDHVMSKATAHNAEKKEMVNRSHGQDESILDEDESMMFTRPLKRKLS